MVVALCKQFHYTQVIQSDKESRGDTFSMSALLMSISGVYRIYRSGRLSVSFIFCYTIIWLFKENLSYVNCEYQAPLFMCLLNFFPSVILPLTNFTLELNWHFFSGGCGVIKQE